LPYKGATEEQIAAFMAGDGSVLSDLDFEQADIDLLQTY
jgi:hypothetical protein